MAGDDPAVSDTIAMAMGRFGIAAHWAANAEDALSLCATGEYNALLADAGMLLRDGRSLLRAAQNARLAILMLHESGVTSEISDGAGAVSLWKPVSEQTLLDALASALGSFNGEGGVCPLIDRDAIAALWPEDTILIFQRIVSLFISETNVRCKAIAEAGQILDRAILRHEAHTLKGAAANVGAARLEQAAAALEVAAPIASVALVASAIAHLCEVAQLTDIALASYGSQKRP